MAERSPEDEALLFEFLAVIEGLSGRQVELIAAGVTDNDLSRWRSDQWSRLTGRKRAAIRSFLAHRRDAAAALKSGGPIEREALDLFGDFDRVVRNIRGLPSSGRGVERKKDAIRGIELYAQSVGKPLPDSFFELRREVYGADKEGSKG